MAPHITMGKDIFDLEFEQDSSTEKSLAKVFRILMGEKMKDKYDNVIQLKSNGDKIKFLTALEKNYQFKTMVKEAKMKKSELRRMIQEEVLNESKLKKLLVRIERHDGTHEMADDYRAVKRGSADKHQIEREITAHLSEFPKDLKKIEKIVKWKNERSHGSQIHLTQPTN
jgi:DNA polymerase II large subunit